LSTFTRLAEIPYTPNISRMRFRLLVTRRVPIGDRFLEPNDVLCLDTEDQTAILGASLPYNPGAALGLLMDGTCAPISEPLASVIAALEPPRPVPEPPGVLRFPLERRRA
jgi:hypothetical protein